MIVPSNSKRPDDEYRDLFLKIHNLKGDVLVLAPSIKKYEEFSSYGGTPQGLLNRDKVIHYINYMYSEKSPLIKKYKDDLMERKTQAAKLAGFVSSDKKEWERVANDLFHLNEDKIFKMIMRFLMIQKNFLLSSIVTAEQAFYEFQYIIAQPLITSDEKKLTETAKNKTILMKDCDEIMNRLKGYYKEFFGDNEDVAIVYKNSDLTLTTPEEISTINRKF